MVSQVLKSPDINLARIEIEALCHDCRKRHRISVLPDYFGQEALNWQGKHLGHEIEFLSAKRRLPKGFDDRLYEKAGEAPWWLAYGENADAKITYVADAAFTLDLSALAASSTFVAGREASKVTNSSNYIDYGISGSYISGTTPTAPAEARLYYIRPTEDTPTWPDVFDGTDSAETVTNTNILATLPLGWSGTASATSNVTYPIVNALTIAQAFGYVPKDFTVFFTHAQTAALKTDAANTNSINYQGLYITIA